VARGTQHRKRRPQAHARVAAQPAKPKGKRVKHQSWEDQLFFARLRHHAKWVFLLLALVFAVGFVIFGVGSGSTGISDALQGFFNRSSSSSSSASSLQKKAEQHPQQAKPWHDLATKLEADGKLDDAIVALKRYTALKPKNQTVLEELAGVYQRRAVEFQHVYTDAQTRSQILAPNSPFQPVSTSALGKAMASLTNPIQSAVTGEISTLTSTAYTKIIQLESDAVGVYQKLAKLSPGDAVTQLRLAQVAQGAGNSTVAITAYTRFLKLAPDDPLAPSARKVLKQLEAQRKATATPVSTHK
jgi:cytochrome c-type biogenesis protein CcmH/NrfG